LAHYLSAVEDKKKLIMLVILHLQLIINQVQSEIPPVLLQEEENEMVRLREILLQDIAKMRNMLMDTATSGIYPVPLQSWGSFLLHTEPIFFYYFLVFAEREGRKNDFLALVFDLQLFIHFCRNTSLPLI
jgi:hypothetical protein